MIKIDIFINKNFMFILYLQLNFKICKNYLYFVNNIKYIIIYLFLKLRRIYKINNISSFLFSNNEKLINFNCITFEINLKKKYENQQNLVFRIVF